MHPLLGVYLGCIAMGILSLPILLGVKGARPTWRLLVVVAAIPVVAQIPGGLRWAAGIQR